MWLRVSESLTGWHPPETLVECRNHGNLLPSPAQSRPCDALKRDRGGRLIRFPSTTGRPRRPVPPASPWRDQKSHPPITPSCSHADSRGWCSEDERALNARTECRRAFWRKSHGVACPSTACPQYPP